ncbi:hypothetical protein XI25_29545 [Paenibacillus sp. DMB20]|nr:hypothetical protein XI25_29545 [Paenibacillus sp. DMB20]
MVKWLWRTKRPEQSTWVYCPGCNEDLCSNNSFVKDADYVYYKCSNCGRESKWDFDAGPVPVEIKMSNQNHISKTTKY